MDTVVRVNEPRELLAYIPYRLGFRPAWSVVLVSLQPVRRGRSRVGLVVRVDLDDLGDPEHGAALGCSVAGHLRADGAGEVLVVVYAELSTEELREHGPWQRARTNLRTALSWARTEQVWAVTPTGYGHLDCADAGCCPPQGRPADELEGTRIGAEMVLHGATVVPGRDGLAVRPSTSAAHRAAALRGASQERERRRVARSATGTGAAFGLPGAAGAHLEDWRAEGAGLWDDLSGRVRAGGSAPARQLGRLAVFLEDRLVRDAVVAALMTVPGGARATECLDPAAVIRAYDEAGAPDREALAPGLQLLTEVAAQAPRGNAAPALGALAYLWWWLGDGARADVLAGQCLAEDPTHRLARLVREALAAGVPPMWVHRGREAPGS